MFKTIFFNIFNFKYFASSIDIIKFKIPVSVSEDSNLYYCFLKAENRILILHKLLI